MQVLLERCIHAGSTTDLGLSYPDLNKAVEDPLSTHHSDESLETVLDAPLTMESAMHLHVPLSLLDHELDLSRHATLTCIHLVLENHSVSTSLHDFVAISCWSIVSLSCSGLPLLEKSGPTVVSIRDHQMCTNAMNSI